MKTMLICPEHRNAGSAFLRMKPLALMPVLGRSLIELHLLDLVATGVKEVLILASDRPEMIRRVVGNGSAWGLSIEVTPTRLELTAEDAVVQHGGRSCWNVRVLDSLPDGTPLWLSHAATFDQLTARVDQPQIAESLTMKEIKPQVWISTKANIADGCIIEAPAWIGPHATVSKGAVIGPGTIVEAHAFVDEMAALKQVWVGPSTYVGAATNIEQSFVWGHTITHWRDGSSLEVRDSFVLNDLSAKPMKRVSWIERAMALLLWVAALPLVMIAMIRAKLKALPLFTERVVMSADRTLVLSALNGASGLLSRWPELWSVVRGELSLVGNRPLTPEAATALRGEIGQLWLSVPGGVFSLADAEGSDAESVAESVAHAAFFAAKRSIALRLRILVSCLMKPFSTTAQLHQQACS